MIRELIEGMEGLEVCGESDSAETALASIGKAQAEMALIDVSLPGMSGIEFVRKLQGSNPEIACVMLSGHSSTRYVEDARAAGAKAYIAKGNVRGMADVLHKVLAGGAFVSI